MTVAVSDKRPSGLHMKKHQASWQLASACEFSVRSDGRSVPSGNVARFQCRLALKASCEWRTTVPYRNKPSQYVSVDSVRVPQTSAGNRCNPPTG